MQRMGGAEPEAERLLTVAAARVHGLRRAGDLRRLTETLAANDPDLIALSEIEAGDALSLATRLALHWGYCGGQAVLCKHPVQIEAIVDDYLPASPLRVFARRGIVQLDLRFKDLQLAVVATRLSESRNAFVRELRFVRSYVRNRTAPLLLFAELESRGHLGFADLGLQPVQPPAKPNAALHVAGVTVIDVWNGAGENWPIAPLFARLAV